MNFKKLLTFLKRKLKSLHFLFLLNGLLVATVFFLFTEAKYEEELFTAIAHKIKNDLPKDFTQTDFVLKALQTTSYLQDRRYAVFGEQEIGGIKATIFHPSTIDLMTNNGACGSYVTVLSRVLKSNNIQVRIGQMQVNGKYGGHMIVEAYMNDKWVVLDPTYTLYFQNPDKSWATFAQIQNNWQFYKSQVPANYNPDYQFQGIRYTNWEKIPVVTTSVKAILNVLLGKKVADGISIRPYLLRNYHKLAWLTFIIWVIVAIYTGKTYLRKKQFVALNFFTTQRKTKVA